MSAVFKIQTCVMTFICQETIKTLSEMKKKNVKGLQLASGLFVGILPENFLPFQIFYFWDWLHFN